MKQKGNNMLSKLTNQEKKVYDLLITALSIKQIAKKINVSVATINTQRSSIYEKLGYNDRNELIINYYQAELQKVKQFILDKGL